MTTHVVRVQKIVPGGAGMARLDDGRVVFVPGALPGERVRVELADAKKGYVVARALRVLDAAPERQRPPCPLAEQSCGCDLMHARYSAQLEYKRDMIRDALERVGKLADLPPIEVTACPDELGYRSRVRLHIDARGRVGYYQRGTHRLLEIERCPIARLELDRVVQRVVQIAAHERRACSAYSEAELRYPIGAARASIALTPRARQSPPNNPFATALAREFDVVSGDEPSDVLDRWPTIEELSLCVPPRAFVQVNWSMNLAIVRALVDGARSRGLRTFVDLYAGVGNFAIALLAVGLSGIAIENNAEAVAAADRALQEQGLTAGKVMNADAAQAIARMTELPGELIVLDPPRAGALPLIGDLVRLAPPFIAYCSCDPVTLARDVSKLTAAGYRIEGLQGFDMFPQTHHVEVLTWLGRAPAR